MNHDARANQRHNIKLTLIVIKFTVFDVVNTTSSTQFRLTITDVNSFHNSINYDTGVSSFDKKLSCWLRSTSACLASRKNNYKHKSCHTTLQRQYSISCICSARQEMTVLTLWSSSSMPQMHATVR